MIRERFIGREAELSRFESLVAGDASRLWWVFGSGGIGKTALMSALADRAVKTGCQVIRADFRTGDQPVDGPTATVLDQLGDDGRSRVVLLLDALEPTPDTTRWLRDGLLSQLPSRSLVVVASRLAPGPALRTDPTWSTLLELVPLRELSPSEAQRLLSSSGVPAELLPRAQELGRGHPLALRLVAEALASRWDGVLPEGMGQTPDLVATLLARLIDEVPDDQHRLAIELAAVARVTSRSLLRDACHPDRAGELFEWLARQPWMDRLADGLCPHDLARDAITADLRGNDPDRYVQARRSVRNHVLDPARRRDDPDRCATDFLYLQRETSALSHAWDWSTFGQSTVTAVEATDREVLTDLVTASYGPASVRALDHWLANQPDGFAVLRSSEGIVGFVVMLRIEDPTAEDLAADPSVAAIWRRVLRRGRPQPGQPVGLFRFVCDFKAGNLPPSPTYNVVTVLGVRYWLSTPGLSLDYVVKPRHGSYRPMMDYVDFAPVVDADHAVGDVEMVVHEHDWRETPLACWLDRMEKLELGAPVPPAVDRTPILSSLDHDAFTDAVRTALRDFTRRDRLAANPLVGSRVVRDGPGAGGPNGLAETLREAFVALEDHPKTERARRAVDRTYLRGAVTQEAAAEVLGMAFSTYRRHLATGIELLVDQMWEWELYGRDP